VTLFYAYQISWNSGILPRTYYLAVASCDAFNHERSQHYWRTQIEPISQVRVTEYSVCCISHLPYHPLTYYLRYPTSVLLNTERVVWKILQFVVLIIEVISKITVAFTKAVVVLDLNMPFELKWVVFPFLYCPTIILGTRNFRIETWT